MNFQNCFQDDHTHTTQLDCIDLVAFNNLENNKNNSLSLIFICAQHEWFMEELKAPSNQHLATLADVNKLLHYTVIS
ncbi:hypothetical protein KSF78_0002866 [Schistosoma japonicum]|nr:hypothetical protein KSF78_0002866 [Schistosoma japonicum]